MKIVAIALRYKKFRASVIQTQSDYQYGLSYMYAALDGNLIGIVGGQDDRFLLTQVDPYTSSGTFEDQHPVYGPIIPTFSPYSTISAWVDVPWDPPEDYYAYAGDSYTFNPDWLLEENRCWWNVWPQTDSPPYIWYIYFYKLQYHFRNYYIPCHNIIPKIIPLLGGVFALLFLGLPGVCQTTSRKRKR